MEAGEILQSSDIGEVHDDIAEEGQTEVFTVHFIFAIIKVRVRLM